MAFLFDDVLVYKGVVLGGCTSDSPSEQTAIGAGDQIATGSAEIDGVVHIGNEDFTRCESSLMVSKSRHQEGPNQVTIRGVQSTNALVVEGHMTVPISTGTIWGSNLVGNIFAGLVGVGFVGSGSIINVQGWKGFDIKHPSEKGYRLRHVCLEGPEGAIYTRGRLKNKKEIVLPEYWKDLVHVDSITVDLQPIGAHQDIIVKRWDAEKIYLQSNGGMPIDCFYHVYGERKDGEKLITEYPGESPEDYPGDNNQYSIAGYHYDRRTL